MRDVVRVHLGPRTYTSCRHVVIRRAYKYMPYSVPVHTKHTPRRPFLSFSFTLFPAYNYYLALDAAPLRIPAGSGRRLPRASLCLGPTTTGVARIGCLAEQRALCSALRRRRRALELTLCCPRRKGARRSGQRAARQTGAPDRTTRLEARGPDEADARAHTQTQARRVKNHAETRNAPPSPLSLCSRQPAHDACLVRGNARLVAIDGRRRTTTAVYGTMTLSA